MSTVLPHIEASAVYDGINFKKPYVDPTNLEAVKARIPAFLCPSTAKTDSARGSGDVISNYGGQTGVSLGCTDYMGIAGPSSKKKNPATNQDYERQKGILIGTKGLEGADTMLVPPSVRFAYVTDGSSNTIMVTECTGRGTEKEDNDPNGAWVSGKNITHVNAGVNTKGAKASWNDELIFSQHYGGSNAVFVDGSVHFLSSETTDEVILSQCSRDGGELFDID